MRPTGMLRSAAFLRRGLATQTSLPVPERSCVSITPPYSALLEKLDHVRSLLNRPLTLAEKILYSHIIDPEKDLSGGGNIRGEVYLQLRPERVAMQDASAQCVCLVRVFICFDFSIFAEWRCMFLNIFATLDSDHT